LIDFFFCNVIEDPFPTNLSAQIYSMARLLLIRVAFLMLVLSGCDNRTQEDRRWDQIAETLNTDKSAQPFTQARDPWSNAEHHQGLAW
jgi:hypothetical protein